MAVLRGAISFVSQIIFFSLGQPLSNPLL